MKPVRNLIFALLLVFAITGKTSAGEVPIPPSPEPPPRATALVPEEGTSTSSGGSSEQSGETVETSDYLMFEALLALLSVY